MKKVLSSLLLASATVMAFAQTQTLIDENFETLTIGNVGTNVSGTAAGQGNMFLSGGVVTDYQIATIDVANGKSLRVTSGNGAPPVSGSNTNTRWVWKDITTTAAAANNIVVTKAKIYTGAANGAGTIKAIIYGTLSGTNTGVIGGIKYNYATKTIQGEAYITLNSVPQSAGLLTITFGTETYPANTWVDVEHRYNKTTGQHQYKYGNSVWYSYNTGQVNSGGTIYTGTTVPNLFPLEADIVSETAAGNTVANTTGIDNWKVEYSNASFLSVGEVKNVTEGKLSTTIYPNPTTDILNIKSESKINNVTVVDMSGRNMEVKLENNQVNVQALPVGSYLINIETKDGISTEKFIKK